MLEIKIDVYHHIDSTVNAGVLQEVLAHLAALKSQGEKIMANQQELTTQVKAANDKLTKIGTETRSLLDKIDQLQAAVDSAGNVTPELQSAVDALAAQADVVDQLVPDATPPEPPPAP